MKHAPLKGMEQGNNMIVPAAKNWNSLGKLFTLILTVSINFCISQNISAQCDAGLNVPIYPVDLCSDPNKTVIGFL